MVDQPIVLHNLFIGYNIISFMSKDKTKKKRLKAEKKLAKSRVKYPKTNRWYKNPDWIRAIVSIIAIALTVIGFFYFR